jgi:hypothetical protein
VPVNEYCLFVDIYSFAFSAGGVASLGFTADPGPGAWLGAELRPIEAFSMGFELRGLFPSRVVAAEPINPNLPFESPKEPIVTNVEMLVVPCFRYWWLMGCAVGHIGFSISETPAGFGGWPAYGIGPRVGIEVPITDRFFVRGHGDVLVDFADPTLELPDVNLKWKQNIVSGFIGLGVGMSFR